ncbi:MAG: hypothetical protein ACYSSI_12620, partial [Planctomycetota bacterium]
LHNYILGGIKMSDSKCIKDDEKIKRCVLKLRELLEPHKSKGGLWGHLAVFLDNHILCHMWFKTINTVPPKTSKTQ